MLEEMDAVFHAAWLRSYEHQWEGRLDALEGLFRESGQDPARPPR
jgi:hypothetical protein